MPAGIPNSQNGLVKVVTGADPAANNEFSITVPAGKIWQLLSVSVSLAQGATQTPQPALVIDDGTTTIFQSFGASTAQNSAVTTRYTWAPDCTLTAGGAATVVTAPLASGLILPQNSRLRSITAGIGANTNYDVPAALVVEF